MVKIQSILYLGILLMLGLAASSCVRHKEIETDKSGQEQVQPVATPDSISFTAFLEPGSRTLLGENYSVLWSTGDKVRVFNSANPSGVEFTLSAGAGSTAGTFSAPGSGIGDGPFYAVYPSEAATALNGTAVSISVPSVQTYAEGSFGPKANIAAGKADVLEEIRFRNLLGAVEFTLTGSATVTGVSIRARGTAQLNGAATINGWDDEAPSLSFGTDQTADSFRQISLDCGTGSALTSYGKTFYISVPAGTMGDGFTFEADDAQGGSMVIYAGVVEGNKVARSGLLQMPSLAYQANYKKDFLIATDPGACINILSEGEMLYQCSYTEGVSQYAYKNTTGDSGTRYVRLEDWEEEYMLAVTMPYALAEGMNVDVTVKATGDTGAITSSDGAVTMRVVKKTDDLVWLADAATGNGYILMMVED